MNSKPIEFEPSAIMSYMKAVQLLGKWKAIPLGSFHNIHPKKIHKTYSYRLAGKLVKAGVAHKIKCLMSNCHVLIPTEKALDFTYSNFNMSEFETYCRLSFIASAFIELTVFKNKVVRFMHEEDAPDPAQKKLIADFTIEGVNSESTVFHMGVFFEPTHYSRLNSHERMMRYVDKENFKVIILIFKKRGDLNKRREIYFENKEHKYGKVLKEYICLVHIDDYLKGPEDIIKSYVFFQGEETTLEKLFM